MTPAARSSAESEARTFTAPRILNEPVRCRFSALSRSSRPVRKASASDGYTAVRCARSPMRSRAAWMSARLGPVFVAIGVAARVGLVGEVEHGLEDGMHRGERIELTPFDAVQEAPQLGIVGDRVLQMPARAGGGDREDLGGQVAAPSLVERAIALEPFTVRRDRLPKLGDALAAHGFGE